MERFTVGLTKIPGLLVVFFIRVYQVAASPFPSPCKYSPTCSVYTIDAVRNWGAIKGSWMGAKRILRCNPFSKGGIDPVPEKQR